LALWLVNRQPDRIARLTGDKREIGRSGNDGPVARATTGAAAVSPDHAEASRGRRTEGLPSAGGRSVNVLHHLAEVADSDVHAVRGRSSRIEGEDAADTP
jgi:hypothetical protein